MAIDPVERERQRKREYAERHRRESYTIVIRIPPSDADRIKEAAEAAKSSMRAYILKAVQERMEREGREHSHASE